MLKMCKFYSCIIDRRFKVWSDPNDSSHAAVLAIKGFPWKDTKLEDRDFVKVEITPKVGTFSTDMTNWMFKVDEEGTLPTWFNEHLPRAKRECYVVLKRYLRECHADKIDAFLKSIKDVPFFKPDSCPKPEWKMFYGKDWGAAWGAAWDAARDAAWDAASGAAWGAARDAARGAARGAARDAASGAARGAASDAARMVRNILTSDLKIAQKHRDYMRARWEVWTKGYGCYCDVNGVLYVYAPLKYKPKAKS